MTALSHLWVARNPLKSLLFLMRKSWQAASGPVGRFPDKKLIDARADARVALADLRQGRDPKIERVARAKAIEAGSTTVNALADRWLAEYVRPKLKPRTIRDYEGLLNQRIRPALGHLPVSTVAKDHVIKLHADLAKTPRRANYVIAAVRALMTFHRLDDGNALSLDHAIPPSCSRP
jgi:Phage integrase, N-terminal SAM-like domain/Arm DNA-binding domain